jgi:hypothetical protein
MLIHVSRVRSHVASRLTWHSYDGSEILFLLDGTTAHEFSGQKGVALHGGHRLLVPPRLVHRGLHDMRSSYTICGLALKVSRASGWRTTAFTTPDLRRLRRALEQGSSNAHPFSPALRWLVRRLMEETANYATTPHRAEAGIALRALICAVLVESVRQILVPPTEPKEFVSAAITYLRQHLQDAARTLGSEERSTPAVVGCPGPRLPFNGRRTRRLQPLIPSRRVADWFGGDLDKASGVRHAMAQCDDVFASAGEPQNVLRHPVIVDQQGSTGRSAESYCA